MPLSTFFSWIMKKRVHQIELFKKYPLEVQAETLKKLLNAAQNTKYGRAHNFEEIKNYTEFKAQLPLTDYESFKPIVERLKKGEQNITWPTEVNWFAKSSGTTNDKSKFIPITRESLEDCHYKGGKDLLALYCANFPDTNIYSGKTLVVGGSAELNYFRDDSYFGDLSAILIKNLPFWVEFRRTPNTHIALMDKWEEKIESMAQATIEEDVTNIVGVPSWTLVLINRVLEIKKTNNLLEVWPNLELFMHGGVSFKPYKEQFKSLIPSAQMHYVESYNASEGFFGIQDVDGLEELLLMLDYGIYYEFIPLSEVDSNNPITLNLAEVELDTTYAVVISTNTGLWRYQLGDTIKFTSLTPYRFTIVGRTKHFINAFGEELMIDNAEKALAKACSLTNALIKDYTAGPIYFSEFSAGAHEWLIEFEREPENLEEFKIILDTELKAINSDYEAKRTGNLTLRMPVVNKLPANTFYNWLKSKNKLGGQNKVPRLANDRRFLEEIHAMLTTQV
ncbi:MAG: GH3 auxin-responsive promoter family protein [Luteibaculaceae bacterium]